MKVFKSISNNFQSFNKISGVHVNCRIIFLALLYLIVSLVLPGCAKKTEISTQSVDGTYSGVTEDGKPITLTIDQVKRGFMGQGTIDGKPVVISGVQIWSATGAFSNSDGTSNLVKLYLEPGSDNLIIESLGGPQTILSSGGVLVTLPSGPFSGKYKVKGEGEGFASAKITQVSSLIVGTAKISDRFASITGNVVETNRAKGTITYIDESQVYFEAVLSPDGQNITFSGLGEPIILEKF